MTSTCRAVNEACASGDIETIQKIFTLFPNTYPFLNSLGYRIEDSCTNPFIQACKHNNLNIAEYISRCLMAKDDVISAMCVVLDKGDLEAANWLVEKYPNLVLDDTFFSDSDLTFLYISTFGGIATMGWLLERFPDVCKIYTESGKVTEVTETVKADNTDLFYHCCSNCKWDEAEWLIKNVPGAMQSGDLERSLISLCSRLADHSKPSELLERFKWEISDAEKVVSWIYLSGNHGNATWLCDKLIDKDILSVAYALRTVEGDEQTLAKHSFRCADTLEEIKNVVAMFPDVNFMEQAQEKIANVIYPEKSEAVKLLRNMYPDICCLIESEPKHMELALLAISRESLAEVQEFLECYPDVNIHFGDEYFLRNALYYRNMDVVNWLIENYPDTNIRANGDYFIWTCCTQSREKIDEMLEMSDDEVKYIEIDEEYYIVSKYTIMNDWPLLEEYKSYHIYSASLATKVDQVKAIIDDVA